MVFVHANAGKVVNRYSTIDRRALPRLFEQNTGNQIWQEGDPFPGALNGDQQNIVNFSGHSYYHFFNAFGRDSYDGAGAHMRSVNNDPTIACPNANWNGATTNYCNGVTSDDVVAHEWGHAYTRVHAQPDLPVAAGRAQRVVLGHLGRDGRPDQRRRHRLAGAGPHGRRLLDAHGSSAECRDQQPGRRSPGSCPPGLPRSARR